MCIHACVSLTPFFPSVTYINRVHKSQVYSLIFTYVSLTSRYRSFLMPQKVPSCSIPDMSPKGNLSAPSVSCPCSGTLFKCYHTVYTSVWLPSLIPNSEIDLKCLCEAVVISFSSLLINALQTKTIKNIFVVE